MRRIIIVFLMIILMIKQESLAINLSNYKNIANIQLDKSHLINNSIKLDFKDCSSVEGVILNFQNYKFKSISNITLNCNSTCLVIFINDENINIKKLELNNIFFKKQPSSKIDNLIINSSSSVSTALPKKMQQIEINIHENEDMAYAQKLIRGVNILPGSGEYVYDTNILYANNNQASYPINSNNPKKIADTLYNLEELKNTIPKLQWASPAISWFAYSDDGSLDLGNLKVKPAVMQRQSNIDEKWLVSNFNRDNAHLISKDKNGKPSYGGTPSDKSVLRYINELKRRGYKVMFYPFLMVDLPGKPWRGSLSTTSTAAMNDFFNKSKGRYSDYILHYANLLKGKVDAFVIGSEMENLTNFIDTIYEYPNPKRYPGVIKLINLAKQVREILGDKVIITYAANWSEYHHSKEGYFHLDPLWASKYIDVVGIDAYLPLTNQTMGDINLEQIKNGWESGELWDYYYKNDNSEPISKSWGLKRIEHWWQSKHITAQNIESEWKPRMKPIWFTEFGFPSMHLGTNQPSMFYDPSTKDASKLKKSSGRPDFQLQARAIRATLEYWQNKPHIVENMFLWAWDARPFSVFPQNKQLYVDGHSWSRGHWINGKIKPALEINITSDFATENFITNADQIYFKNNVHCKIANDPSNISQNCKSNLSIFKKLKKILSSIFN